MLDLLQPAPILLPVIGLVIWTQIMLGWLVVTRLPAIQAAKLGAQLPKEVQWKADNYNHLLEQPTVFYAVALALAIAGQGDGLNLWLAWFYLGSRIVHSIVQSTSNKVLIRFGLFSLGTLAVIAMAINGAIALI